MKKSLQEYQKLVGSVLILGFSGTELPKITQNFLKDWQAAGVILFKRNIQSFEQLVQLNQSILRLTELTPFISVDHEGGKVFRLPQPFTVFPPMVHVGNYVKKMQDLSFAFQVGQALGRELRSVGFNLNYAPVLDVNSNPDNPIIGARAFSSDPEEVARIALAFVKGLHETGVLSCGKHFPGHGDTSEDSHLTLPTVKKKLEELRQCEFFPFKALIEHKIPTLMTAHVMYPALDPEWPATLSEKILTGVLKKEMGFQGLILSDDFFMKGIAAHWSIPEAVERFLRCGGDIALLCHEEETQVQVAEYLCKQLEKDTRFREALQEKYIKINKLRDKLSFKIDPELFSKYQAEHQNLAEKLKND